MSKPIFRKLAPTRVFEQIVDEVRDMILEGKFKPGDKLPPEQELEKQFNVSRSSIREALRVLEYDGFVKVRRGIGIFISDYTKHQRGRIEIAKWLEKQENTLQDLLQTREYLEGLTASLSAVNADSKMIDTLKSIHDKLSRLAKPEIINSDIDVSELSKFDLRFHLFISESSGNSLAHELISSIVPAFQESNKAVIYIGSSPEKMIEDHNNILKAIESRDPHAAELAMRNHISRVRSEFQNINSSVLEDSNLKEID